MSHLSICFAVYQNEGALTILHDKIVKELAAHFPEDTYELIFVNDGSKDNSFNELKELKKKNDNVVIINFSRNFGQMATILAGWHHAKGDIVVNMAADLQDPPEQCMQMIHEWKKGSDIVISYRKSHATSKGKKLTSKIFYKLLLPTAPPGGFDFALLNRNAMDSINSLKERNRFYQYDILWAGFNVKYLPYDKAERTIGVSQYNFFRRFNNFYTALLNVSYLPLRMLSGIGLFVACLGFLYSINIVYAFYVNNTPFEGWAPIMITLLILSGLIMLMLGVLGEYIWRILDEVKHRPNYVIKDVID